MSTKSRPVFMLAVFCLISLSGTLWVGGQDDHVISTLELSPEQAFERKAGYAGRADTYILQHMALPLSPDAQPESRVMTARVSNAYTASLTYTTYLPLTTVTDIAPMAERRGLWITRYDWTLYSTAPSPGDVQTIVDHAAYAGFNSLFFQVRATGDSYYTPGLEPWAARLTTGPVSETLGVNPGWDPLAVMLQAAHHSGLEVHAYINVYTAWMPPPESEGGTLWPPVTSPHHMFDTFTYSPLYSAHPGTYGMGYTWRQYTYPDTPMPLAWKEYLWASPGVDEVQDYIAAVVADIVSRYDIDGVHLDLVRYAGPSYSYDPLSSAAAGGERNPARDQWQRDRITSLVARISTQAHVLSPDILVSAAVWPYYVDKWGWGTSEGYSDYFQDSVGWLQSGAVDAIAPMLYGGSLEDFTRWQILMTDFISVSSAGQVYPGVGVYDDFSRTAGRITAARDAGAPGHIVFSYSGLNQHDYWDELRDGPYALPAIIPEH
ncbi:MAG: family 10 glycosylhydrolase [Anaerolineae bacterium]|nr:family 10 glycosylhydrolase [Anaerolineae bacterium]